MPSIASDQPTDLVRHSIDMPVLVELRALVGLLEEVDCEATEVVLRSLENHPFVDHRSSSGGGGLRSIVFEELQIVRSERRQRP